MTRIDRDGTTLIDAADRGRIDRGAAARVQGLTKDEPVQPWVETPFPACGIVAGDDGHSLLAWEDGDYQVTRGDGSVESVSGQPAPGRLRSKARGRSRSRPDGTRRRRSNSTALRPWSALDDPAAAAFSGTATYACTLKLEAPAADSRLLLDLGRVADIAEVTVNGHALPPRWAPPFRFDLTEKIRAGANRIEVAVTNTWHNRLAHDAALRPGKRKTWTINAPAADAPRQEAGLIGPVTLHHGKRIALGRHRPGHRVTGAAQRIRVINAR